MALLLNLKQTSAAKAACVARLNGMAKAMPFYEPSLRDNAVLRRQGGGAAMRRKPQRLKPLSIARSDGMAKAMPLYEPSPAEVRSPSRTFASRFICSGDSLSAAAHDF